MTSLKEEIELARTAGVNDPENLPFLLTPETPNGQGVLLVHGFCASPREMRPLADFLLQRNFTVLAVWLPGHGTSPQDLARRNYEEWLAATERGYQILRRMNLSVSAVGLSTGCLILLLLSLSYPLSSQVLLAPYLRLKHPLAPLVGPLSLLIPYQTREIDPAEQAFYYQRRPLKGIVQLNRLKRKVKKKLPNIKTPALIITSTGDRTIYPETAKELYEQLGSPVKAFHCYGDEVPHVLTAQSNPQQADVFRKTARFLEKFSLN